MEEIRLWQPSLKNKDWYETIKFGINELRKDVYPNRIHQLVEELTELSEALYLDMISSTDENIYPPVLEEMGDVLLSIATILSEDEKVEIDRDFPETVYKNMSVALRVLINTTIYHAMKSLRMDKDANDFINDYSKLKVDLISIQKYIHMLIRTLNYNDMELMDVMQFKCRRYFYRKYKFLKLDTLPPYLERSFDKDGTPQPFDP